MANQRKIIGKIPVYRGNWSSSNAPYHKLNDVTLYGCMFRSKIENNSYQPATIGAGGELVVNENWYLVTSGYESEAIKEDLAFIDNNTNAYNVSRFHSHTGFWEAIEYDESQPAYMEAQQYSAGSKVNLVNYTNHTFVAMKSLTGVQPDINTVTNKFTLEEAVLLVPKKYQLSGIEIGFISSETNKPVFHRYNGGTFTSVDSWTGDTVEKLTELERNNYIETFPYNKIVDISSGFENGILRNDGKLISFEGYTTSDYIDINAFENSTLILTLFSGEQEVSNLYLIIAFYDKNKNFINGIYKGDIGNNILRSNKSVKYIRYIKKEKNILRQCYYNFDLYNFLTYHNDNKNNGIFGNYYNPTEIIEVTFETGLLVKGSINTSFQGFQTSEYIECNENDLMLLYNILNISSGYDMFAFYDKDKNYITSYPCNNTTLLRKYVPIIKPYGAYYLRYSTQNSEKLLYKAISSSLYSDIQGKLNKDNIVRFGLSIAPSEIILNKRFNQTSGDILDANGFALFKYEITDESDIEYYNASFTSQQYVPGVYYFKDDEYLGNQYATSSTVTYYENSKLTLKEETNIIYLCCNVQESIATEELAQKYLSLRKVIIGDYNTYDKYYTNFLIKRLSESQIDNKSLISSFWYGKKAVQFGTSIPAGGTWNVNNKDSYPLIAANMLGLTMYNEAVGSSKAKGGTTLEWWEPYSRRMGQTVQEKLAAFNDMWTVDDNLKTVTNGPRIMGFAPNTVPNITTYDDAVNLRHLVVQCSYEVKLVAKYLLANNINYLQDKLGSMYDVLTSYRPQDWEYKDVDLFIFDHGHNDSLREADLSVDIDSNDITTFFGAMNTYISLIYQYKPQARICVISDYANYNSDNKTIECQEKLALNWSLPFFNISNTLPFKASNKKVVTSGYWDYNGIWHDNGFTWSETEDSYTTNANLNARLKGDGTLAQVKVNINPRQINGIWVYDIDIRSMFICDDLHPHSDKSGKCLAMYAKSETAFLQSFGIG